MQERVCFNGETEFYRGATAELGLGMQEQHGVKEQPLVLAELAIGVCQARRG